MADTERWYKIGDLEYPSVTTVLGASLAKQNMLIPWAVKGYHQEIVDWIKEHPFQHPDDSMEEIIEKRTARGLASAHVGSLAHDLISESIGIPYGGVLSLDWCKEVLGDKENPVAYPKGGTPWVGLDEDMTNHFKHHEVYQSPENVEQVLNIVLAWEQWCQDFDVGPGHADGVEPKHTWDVAHSEKLVYFEPSKTANGGKPNNRYAGTADLIIQRREHPEYKYLIDIKTGKLYNEALYQVSAYAFAYAETMQKELGDGASHEHFIQRCFLLQLHKDDIAKERYTLKEAKDWRTLLHQGFTPCLDWFYEFKKHTPGRKISAENFLLTPTQIWNLEHPDQQV